MDISQRAERERDLVTYYDNEIDERSGRELTRERVAGRTAFIERMHREGCRTVLEVGRGPGREGRALADASFDTGWTMSTLCMSRTRTFIQPCPRS